MSDQDLHQNKIPDNMVGKLSSIKAEVTRKYNIPSPGLFKKDKKPIFIAARREFFYRASTETTWTLSLVARFSRCDRSTVVHAISAYCALEKKELPRGADWLKYRTLQKKYFGGAS